MELEQLGPYRLGRQLGKGGMGAVYAGVDAATGQHVAVKALAPQLAMAEGFRERFEAEIESLKKLQHEGIVRLYGYGEDEGVLFYSMELVEGPSLEQAVRDGRRFDWNETLSIAIQVCRALKHAHDHGVVHRDIKPANLLLADATRVKIADFGIARLFGSTQLTNFGGVLGTADYMSPEQVDGRAVTDRCDQYSLGCVMFTLLAGRPPFRAQSMAEMLQMQRYAEPEPVRRFAPETPKPVEQLIRQLLSKDPADRFPNALVLARHMEAMHKALLRPERASDSPPTDVHDLRLAEGAGETLDPDATAVQRRDVTEAPLARLETTDSDVYDAPTLADDGGAGARLGGGSPAAAAPPAPLAKPRRFTTVDEDAQRARQAESDTWARTLQLAGLAAALATLAYVGWRTTRPLTADALHAEIAAEIEENGADDLRRLDDEITEFVERFPGDPRIEEVRAYAAELELQRLERRVLTRARLRGSAASHPAEAAYLEAVAQEATNPAEAAALLEAIVALYAPRSGEPVEDEYATLAERRLADIRQSAEAECAEQLPAVRERLSAAKRLEAEDPARARQMFAALVKLYGDRAWAADVVAEAQAHLAPPAQSAAK